MTEEMTEQQIADNAPVKVFTIGSKTFTATARPIAKVNPWLRRVEETLGQSSQIDAMPDVMEKLRAQREWVNSLCALMAEYDPEQIPADVVSEATGPQLIEALLILKEVNDPLSAFTGSATRKRIATI